MHAVGVKGLSIVLISVLIAAASFQSMAFVVTGTGTVVTPDSSISGESIEFSFSYDVSDFGNRVLSPDVGAYYALRPIPVKVTGSISGPIDSDPIYRVVIWDNSAGLRYDVWQFYLLRDNGDAAVALSAYNLSGNAFSAPLPDSFADAHALFFPQVNNPAVWMHRGPGGIDGVTLRDLEWRIVPAPGTLQLVALGLFSFCLLRLVRCPAVDRCALTSQHADHVGTGLPGLTT
jgi:hypothetical protein